MYLSSHHLSIQSVLPIAWPAQIRSSAPAVPWVHQTISFSGFSALPAWDSENRMRQRMGKTCVRLLCSQLMMMMMMMMMMMILMNESTIYGPIFSLTRFCFFLQVSLDFLFICIHYESFFNTQADPCHLIGGLSGHVIANKLTNITYYITVVFSNQNHKDLLWMF